MEHIERIDAAADLPLGPRPAGCAVPLTAAQRRRFELLEKHGRLSTRMCATAVQILGELKVDLLISSLNTLAHRHEALRTRIVRADGSLQQLVDPSGECFLETIDLTHSASNAHEEALRLAQAFIDKQTDLFLDPLFAAQLIRLSDREHALIILLDHMVCDAASCLILNKELWTLYEAAEKGQPCSLPQLPVQYPDYAVWQQRTYDSWQERHGPYWKQRLTGAPHVLIPTDPGLIEAAEPSGAVVHVLLGHDLSTQLRNFAKRQHTLLPLVVLTVYVIVMAHWCSQNDLLVEFLTHGRHRRPELKHMIGDVASSLYLRITIERHDSYLDLLTKIDRELSSAYLHQDHGQLHRDLPSGITDLAFNWLPNLAGKGNQRQANANTGRRLQPLPIRIAWPCKFYPHFSESAAGIGATIHFRLDLISTETIKRFGYLLRQTAQALTQSPFSQVITAGSTVPSTGMAIQ